jgi:hypothetical protein
MPPCLLLFKGVGAHFLDELKRSRGVCGVRLVS